MNAYTLETLAYLDPWTLEDDARSNLLIARAAEKDSPERKALDLFQNSLDEHQRKMLWQSGFITVRGYSEKQYILRITNAYGIVLVAHHSHEQYHYIAEICANPRLHWSMDVPYQLKEMLEARGGEEEIYRNANIRLYRPPMCAFDACDNVWYDTKTELYRLHKQSTGQFMNSAGTYELYA